MAVLTGIFTKMDKKVTTKNIFESGFDSFELDDGFFIKMDDDIKKNSVNVRNCGNKIDYLKESEKLNKKGNKDDNFGKNAKNFDLSLFIEDLDESDLFEMSKIKNQTSKRMACHNLEEEKVKKLCSSSTATSCLSPILGSKSCSKINISSSTPIKPNEELPLTQKAETCSKQMSNTPTASEFDYLEADLFEDWNLEEMNKCNTQRETVTLSLALEMIEKEEQSGQQEQRNPSQTSRNINTDQLNKSIDLLTGEVIDAEMENLFSVSFDKLNSVEKEQGSQKKIISDSQVMKTEDLETYRKPPAAQRLNFDYKNPNEEKEKQKVFSNICFSSDDDFDFVTQDVLNKVKRHSKSDKSGKDSSNLLNKNSKKSDLNESVEEVIIIKKRKNFNVIDSDTTEDSPSPKFHRARARTKKQENFKNDIGKEFLDLEADVSEEIVVSSDEVDEEGEYDNSFVDEESYCTQNQSADIMAKYLQSVKGLNHPGSFKIPAVKPYDPENIFSQVPEENNTEYQIDSFCVSDVEEEVKTDLSDLEIAEKILEMDKKERRKKRFNKSKRSK